MPIRTPLAWLNLKVEDTPCFGMAETRWMKAATGFIPLSRLARLTASTWPATTGKSSGALDDPAA